MNRPLKIVWKLWGMDLSGWTQIPRAHMLTVIDIVFLWKANNFMCYWACIVGVKTELVIRTCRRTQHTELTQRHPPAGSQGDDKKLKDHNQKKVKFVRNGIRKYLQYCWGDFRDEKPKQIGTTFHFSINFIHFCKEHLIIDFFKLPT